MLEPGQVLVPPVPAFPVYRVVCKFMQTPRKHVSASPPNQMQTSAHTRESRRTSPSSSRCSSPPPQQRCMRSSPAFQIHPNALKENWSALAIQSSCSVRQRTLDVLGHVVEVIAEVFSARCEHSQGASPISCSASCIAIQWDLLAVLRTNMKDNDILIRGFPPVLSILIREMSGEFVEDYALHLRIRLHAIRH